MNETQAIKLLIEVAELAQQNGIFKTLQDANVIKQACDFMAQKDKERQEIESEEQERLKRLKEIQNLREELRKEVESEMRGIDIKLEK